MCLPPLLGSLSPEGAERTWPAGYRSPCGSAVSLQVAPELASKLVPTVGEETLWTTKAIRLVVNCVSLIPLAFWSLDISMGNRALPIGYVVSVASVLLLLLSGLTAESVSKPDPKKSRRNTGDDFYSTDAESRTGHHAKGDYYGM